MAQLSEKVFHIRVTEGRSSKAVIALGQYEGKNSKITARNFPMRGMATGFRIIVYLEFDHEATSEEVLREAQLWCLERPRYEDALLFGEQYAPEQRGERVVFLHEPWRRWRFGKPLVMVFSRYFFCNCNGLMLIRCDKPAHTDKWPADCKFAFIRRQG